MRVAQVAQRAAVNIHTEGETGALPRMADYTVGAGQDQGCVDAAGGIGDLPGGGGKGSGEGGAELQRRGGPASGGALARWDERVGTAGAAAAGALATAHAGSLPAGAAHGTRRLAA